MTFKITPTKEVLTYLEKYVVKSEDKERSKNAIDILEFIKTGIWEVNFAFVNEYGEKYLSLKISEERNAWCGDESDWSFANSYYEDHFVNEMIEVKRLEIKKEGGDK